MNLVKVLKEFAQHLGSAIVKGLGYATAKGLTDDLINIAVGEAKRAATSIADNQERRDWVVAQLEARGVPESVARFATEWAVQIIKAETSKL